MKKYYYADGDNHYGPYSIEELKKFRIFPETLVWHEGLSDWMPASQVQELNHLIIYNQSSTQKSQPFNPPQKQVHQQGTINQSQPHSTRNVANTSAPPKNGLVPAILVTLFCCMPFGIMAIVHATKVDPLYKSGDIAGAEEAAKNAAKWTKYGLVGGGIVIGIYILLLASGELQGF